jgi:hypothetical protein
MNIFYLNPNPRICAEMHLDKHVVKMIVEYAQLLSTAHRVLDGEKFTDKTANNRSIQRWRLTDDVLEKNLYKATHANHPSAVWVRQSVQNYMWLAELLEELCGEYTHRYGKVHKVERDGLMQMLKNNFPVMLSDGGFTEPTPAMPDTYKVTNDSIKSYQNYYIHDKARFAKWKNREAPEWFSYGVNNANLQLSPS